MSNNKTKSSNKTDKDKHLSDECMKLKTFREKRAQVLKRRFDIFSKKMENKIVYDVDSIKFVPISSKSDIDIINKLVELKDHITIPVFNDNMITHIYTLGLWYYWGLPEIVIKLEKYPNIKSLRYMNIIIDIVRNELYDKYIDKIVNEKNRNSIKVIDYEKEPDELAFHINEYDVDLKIKKMKDNEYIEMKTDFMLWFYSFYANVDYDKNGEIKMYPVYMLNLTETELDDILYKIIIKLSNKSKTDTDSSSDSDAKDK